MKNIYYFLLITSLTFFLSSCDKDSEDVSRITTYCTFHMNGDAVMYHQIGQAFVDPGCTATEGETEVEVTSSSNVDPEKGGTYRINYKAVNSDGFTATTSRTVKVYYPNENIFGNWKATITYNTTVRGPYTLEILPYTANTFYIPDLLGAWYWVGANYGSGYAFPCILQIESDNTLTILSASKSIWGSVGVFDENTTPTYDPATKTISYVARMSDVDTMLFKVTLVKE